MGKLDALHLIALEGTLEDEAMGGSLTPQETPGGGLTMILSLSSAGRHPPAPSLPASPSQATP